MCIIKEYVPRCKARNPFALVRLSSCLRKLKCFENNKLSCAHDKQICGTMIFSERQSARSLVIIYFSILHNLPLRRETAIIFHSIKFQFKNRAPVTTCSHLESTGFAICLSSVFPCESTIFVSTLFSYVCERLQSKNGTRITFRRPKPPEPRHSSIGTLKVRFKVRKPQDVG